MLCAVSAGGYKLYISHICSQATGVTIVSFGFETKSGKAFLHDVSDVSFEVVDPWESLPRDPNAAVGHCQNGSYSQTQVTVFSQDGFGPFIKSLVSKVSGTCIRRCVSKVQLQGVWRTF